MYKLIEFLRRIYVAVLFVVFEAIAIGYYAHSSNYTQAKLLTRSNQVVGGVNGIFADIRSYFTLGRENERLLERVAVLEEELAFYRRSAADSVRTDLLHDMGEKPYELTVARVISNSINKLFGVCPFNLTSPPLASARKIIRIIFTVSAGCIQNGLQLRLIRV